MSVSNTHQMLIQQNNLWSYPLIGLRSLSSNYSNKTLFGIVQGGMYPLLREKSRDELIKMNFDGYALGGLSVEGATRIDARYN